MSMSTKKLQTKGTNAKWATTDDDSEDDSTPQTPTHPLDRPMDPETQPLTSKKKTSDPTTLKGKIKAYFTFQHTWRYYLNPMNYVLLLLTIAVILIGTTNRVFFKKMLYPMSNYSYPLSQLTTFIYIPVFWPVVWYFKLFTNRITPAMLKFPKWKFLIMGALDATGGLLMIFGGTHTAGPMQQLLIQAVIPFTMLFSWIVSLNALAFIFRKILDVHYKWGHYLGAAIIMSGIVTALYPQLAHHSSSNSDQGQSTVFGVTVFFLLTIPTAFSGVYKEIAFKGEEDLDIYYVNAWVSLWQFLVGLLYFPITLAPGFGGLSFTEVPNNFKDSFRCLAGFSTLKDDHCTDAWQFVLAYVIANIFYNIVLLFMLKYGSASLLYVASAVILPLANISFTFKFIMGSQRSSLTKYDIAGLCVILVGLGFYRAMRSESGGSKEKEEGTEDVDESAHYIPVMMATGLEVPIAVRRANSPEYQPRSMTQLRQSYFLRLGIGMPEQPDTEQGNGKGYYESIQ